MERRVVPLFSRHRNTQRLRLFPILHLLMGIHFFLGVCKGRRKGDGMRPGAAALDLPCFSIF